MGFFDDFFFPEVEAPRDPLEDFFFSARKESQAPPAPVPERIDRDFEKRLFESTRRETKPFLKSLVPHGIQNAIEGDPLRSFRETPERIREGTEAIRPLFGRAAPEISSTLSAVESFFTPLEYALPAGLSDSLGSIFEFFGEGVGETARAFGVGDEKVDALKHIGTRVAPFAIPGTIKAGGSAFRGARALGERGTVTKGGKGPAIEPSKTGTTLQSGLVEKNPAMADLVKRTLDRFEEKGQPAFVIDETLYTKDAKYTLNASLEFRGRDALTKLNDLTEAGFKRGYENNFLGQKDNSFNSSSVEFGRKLKIERDAETFARDEAQRIQKEEAKSAEDIQIAEKVENEAFTAETTATGKTIKSAPGRVQISIAKSDKFPERRADFPAVHETKNFSVHKPFHQNPDTGVLDSVTGKGSGGFTITHNGTGLSTGLHPTSISQAKGMIRRLEDQGLDWNFNQGKGMPKKTASEGGNLIRDMIAERKPRPPEVELESALIDQGRGKRRLRTPKEKLAVKRLTAKGKDLERSVRESPIGTQKLAEAQSDLAANKRQLAKEAGPPSRVVDMGDGRVFDVKTEGGGVFFRQQGDKAGFRRASPQLRDEIFGIESNKADPNVVGAQRDPIAEPVAKPTGKARDFAAEDAALLEQTRAKAKEQGREFKSEVEPPIETTQVGKTRELREDPALKEPLPKTAMTKSDIAELGEGEFGIKAIEARRAAEAKAAEVKPIVEPTVAKPLTPKDPPRAPQPPQGQPSPGFEPSGIMNRIVDLEREAKGLHETRGRPTTIPEIEDLASRMMDVDGFAGSRLVNELVANPRPHTGVEAGLLVLEKGRLKFEEARAADALESATKGGNKDRVKAAQDVADRVEQDILTLDEIGGDHRDRNIPWPVFPPSVDEGQLQRVPYDPAQKKC